MTKAPKALSDRLEYAGPVMFGARWASRLAAGLGIGRTQLWAYRNGARPERDVDGMLLDLIEREHDAAIERGVMLTALRHKMLSFIGGARKTES